MHCRPMKVNTSIETSRLKLLTPSLTDAESVANTWSLDGPALSKVAGASLIRRILTNHESNNTGTFRQLCLAVVLKDEGTWIGWCGLSHDEPTLPRPVIFFLLKRAYWGHGYTTEAASAVLSFGLKELGLQQIDGACAFDNLASKRIMEKLGMKYLGLDKEGGHSFTIERSSAG